MTDANTLTPAIIQDARTGEVLTLAYINAESLAKTRETGETWLWSRSRNELWHKGATSGNTQRVVAISEDCDADAFVITVIPNDRHVTPARGRASPEFRRARSTD